MSDSVVSEPVELRPPPSTILIVDDNPVNLQVLVRTLHGSGHRILAAREAASAFEIARRTNPDLILLDIMMPGQDGFDLCRAFKADPQTQNALVIFLSARGDVSDKVLGLGLGAVDYITKPIQADEVIARVSSHLTRQFLERELRRSRDRLDHELRSAARMQRLLLPSTLPTHARVQFSAHYRTSRHAGGDYYDVLELAGGRFGVMVADVSGHGAPAAIVMAMLRAALHARYAHDDPPTVFHGLNRHFAYLWESAMFATATYATVDVDARRLRLSCAGHPMPLRFRRSRGVEPLAVEAVLPLLMMELGAVPCADIELMPGDRILFYTDGVLDRLSADGSMYDPERLASAFAMVAALSAPAIVDGIVSDLDRFAAGHEPEDDQTLVVLAFD